MYPWDRVKNTQIKYRSHIRSHEKTCCWKQRKPSAERKPFFEEINHNDDEILEKYHWWCSFCRKSPKLLLINSLGGVEIFHITKHPDSESFSLCEKCPNTEFFLLRIFTYSDWIRRDTELFSSNADQKKLRI